ncbi:DNA-directed RNA polymerase subunit M [Infirmifilum lucidum]|uniref:DNA-directed RNA polymerase subunit M n=1 Tax=Infirmifilum lucidum TaxID=2776706 RepID=A0A7L9FF36_9CREN|nr:DNA-directed RNA polymerase subunit M [Infirmifilum lucidum]QOJ78408.1 DNA-directed RNA polymerase subunit M [Infirmifilum lucidum]
MEFCPKCGTLMVPKKRQNEVYLVCPNCGYEMKAKDVKGYLTRESVSEEKKTKVSVFDVKSARADEGERDQLREMYEVFLETLEEQEGSSEE